MIGSVENPSSLTKTIILTMFLNKKGLTYEQLHNHNTLLAQLFYDSNYNLSDKNIDYIYGEIKDGCDY